MIAREYRERFGIAVPVAFLAAAALAGLVWLFGDRADGNLTLRILAAATLPLWAFDVSESYQLKARGKSFWSLDRVANAVHAGVCAAIVFTLLFAAIDPVVTLAVGVGSAFGTWFSTPKDRSLDRMAARYDAETPSGSYGLTAAFIRVWPFILAILLAGLVLYPPQTGWTGGYLYFQAVLLVGIGVAYPVSRSVPAALNPWTAKAVGAALLMALAVMNYLSGA